MSIGAVPFNRAFGEAQGPRCARLRMVMLSAFFVFLGLLTLRPFCVPLLGAVYGGSPAQAGLISWAVPGEVRVALREKGACSLGFKPGAVLTTAQSVASAIVPLAGFAPLAPAPAGVRPLVRPRAPAKTGFLADPPLLTFYARSVRILS